MRRALVRITTLASFEPKQMNPLLARELAEAVAERLRSDGALSATATGELEVVNVADDPGAVAEALQRHFPADGLFVGQLPSCHMLGRNGYFQSARLARFPGRLELWLGFKDERYPLLTFMAQTTPIPREER